MVLWGTPHLCGSPLCQRQSPPLWRLERIEKFRLCGGDQRYARWISASFLKKAWQKLLKSFLYMQSFIHPSSACIYASFRRRPLSAQPLRPRFLRRERRLRWRRCPDALYCRIRRQQADPLRLCQDPLWC